MTTSKIGQSSTGAKIDEQLLKTVGVQPDRATPTELMQAVAQVARQQLSERWVDTQAADRDARARRVYYLSMEFLIGRTLSNALSALDLRDSAEVGLVQHAQALEDRGRSRTRRRPRQRRPRAGWPHAFSTRWPPSGCPPSATASATSTACSRRRSRTAPRSRSPIPWLADGTPWEFPRTGINVPVRFGGWVEHHGQGEQAKAVWRPAGEVAAKAYDMVVPGHGTDRVSTLRLWKAVAPAHLDLHAFNTGDYGRAASIKNEYENISWVLYPNDSTPAGRELRLKQEYFFTAASLHDIVGAPHRRARHAHQPGRQGGDPPQRHPPGDRRGRTDAAAVRRPRHGVD